MCAFLATTIEDIFNILNISLDSNELYAKYYVERADSPILDLVTTIKMDKNTTKYLFTGLRASGKTTELRRLKYSLDNDYLIVYFSTMSELELIDVDYKDIILAMIFQTIKYCEQQGIKIDEGLENRIKSLFQRITGMAENTVIDKQVAGYNFGVSLPLIIAQVAGKYKSEVTTRKTIRENTESLLKDIITEFNFLIFNIQEKTKKPLLIIMDDLEKADLAKCEEIFYKHSFTLSQPLCKVIFTIPHALLFSDSWRNVQTTFAIPETYLPVKTIKNKNGTINEEGIKFFKEIIFKRASKDLFDEKVLEKYAIYSGGIISDYLMMIRESCIKAKLLNKNLISVDYVDDIFERVIVRTYSRIIKQEYYSSLKHVYKEKKLLIDDKLQILFYVNAILEYNGEWWFDIHPAICKILIDKCIIDK
jgi:hypothetical protein